MMLPMKWFLLMGLCYPLCSAVSPPTLSAVGAGNCMDSSFRIFSEIRFTGSSYTLSSCTSYCWGDGVAGDQAVGLYVSTDFCACLYDSGTTLSPTGGGSATPNSGVSPIAFSDNNPGSCYRAILVASTAVPSASPTIPPTVVPSMDPSFPPTQPPSLPPSEAPTFSPSFVPTVVPSLAPSLDPSFSPTHSPTLSPSANPTADPTLSPSAPPSQVPSAAPSTSLPTSRPTLRSSPSLSASPNGSVNATTSSEAVEKEDELSSGEVVGVVIGGLGALVLLGVFVCCFLKPSGPRKVYIEEREKEVPK